jgi:hypothetical protein
MRHRALSDLGMPHERRLDPKPRHEQAHHASTAATLSLLGEGIAGVRLEQRAEPRPERLVTQVVERGGGARFREHARFAPVEGLSHPSDPPA